MTDSVLVYGCESSATHARKHVSRWALVF